MNMSDEYIQMIRIAGLLHDYGKIGIPDSILKKNGRLTPEERDIINTHPVRTQQILSQVLRGLHKKFQRLPEPIMNVGMVPAIRRDSKENVFL